MSDMENSDRFDLSVIITTAKQVLTSPTQFYQSMAPVGGYGNPVVFVIVAAVAAGLVGSVWALLGAGPAAGMASGVAAVFLVPIFMVIGSFIGAVVMFVIWKLMGSTCNYETGYRCVAFSMAILPVVAVVSLIPYVGQILQTAWFFLLMFIASVHVHKISEPTAKIVFAVLAGVMLIFSISSEYQARKIAAFAEDLEEKLSAANPLSEDMDSEELGKAAAGFLTGLQEGSGGKALTAEQKAELEQAGAAMGKIMEGLKETAQEFENKNPEDITPQDAGAAMGALFKSLQNAAESMPGNKGSSRLLARQAPSLSTLDIDELASLGVIAKPSNAHAMQFQVNDNARFAPVSGPVKVYRDSAGIRYQISLESAYFREFSSLGEEDSAAVVASLSESVSDSAAASDAPRFEAIGEQNILVDNAGIFVFDESGVLISGDSCQQSVLQIGAQNSSSASRSTQELWLWCPESARNSL